MDRRLRAKPLEVRPGHPIAGSGLHHPLDLIDPLDLPQ